MTGRSQHNIPPITAPDYSTRAISQTIGSIGNSYLPQRGHSTSYTSRVALTISRSSGASGRARTGPWSGYFGHLSRSGVGGMTGLRLRSARECYPADAWRSVRCRTAKLLKLRLSEVSRQLMLIPTAPVTEYLENVAVDFGYHFAFVQRKQSLGRPFVTTRALYRA
jgi:hypothetical protein